MGIPPDDMDALLDHFDVDEAKLDEVLTSPGMAAIVEHFAGQVLEKIDPFLQVGIDVESTALSSYTGPAAPIAQRIMSAAQKGVLAKVEAWLLSKDQQKE